MVARFLLYCTSLFLSACLASSDSKQPNNPITYTITALGSERYQVAFEANISGEHSGYWQFGDGYVSSGRSVNHIYYSPGQYTITYSYERNGQQSQLTDTLVLEGATHNIDVISRELIVIDSDHNDPNQPWQRNDVTPQKIVAPTKVSGIMIAKGHCQTGHLCRDGDDVDRYRLHTKQDIALAIQNYDGELSISISGFDTSLVNHARIELTAGHYDIALQRITDTVRYTLVAQPSQASSAEATQASSFQPGKLIVQYKNQTKPELVDISDPRLRQYRSIQHARNALQQQQNVHAVSYNYWRFSRGYHQWSLSEFGIPLLWQLLPNQGHDVRVAVIDTGLYRHSDLSEATIVDGYDFISDPLQSDDGDGWDPNPYDDSGSGHGTHVTGIIASQGELNGNSIAGISPNVQIMPLRAIGRFGATSYDLIQSLLYAAALDNDASQRPSRPADIINLSLGGEKFSQIESDVIQTLSELGVIVIAASGNQGATTVDYPAAYANVLAVGAHDRYGDVTSYSNTGHALDLIAPGGDCKDPACTGGITNLNQSDVQTLTGTSMSTAFVTGIVANLKSHLSQLDAVDLQSLIEAGQITTSSTHNSQQGWGTIDMNKLGWVANHTQNSGLGTRLWLPKKIHFEQSEDVIRIPFRLSDDTPLNQLHMSVLPSELDYDIRKINNYLYELHLRNFTNTSDISIRYHDGLEWRSLKTLLRKNSDGYHVDFLDHLYVQMDSKRTPLRASTKQIGWQLQYPIGTSDQTIQVSSDIDYDGIYCEWGEFCGQLLGCQNPLARSVNQCSSDDLQSPLSGKLISHD